VTRVRATHVRATSRSGTDRGSVLMLVPAGFLVFMILAALAVDSASAYLGQQQLHDSLVAAANDAVTAGLSNQSFYGRGAVTIDPAAAGRAVCASMAAQSDSDLHGIEIWMAVDGEALRLEGTATVDAVFGRAIPHFGRRHVDAQVRAVVTGRPLPAAGQGSPSAPLAPVTCW
jgi:hypothetical protein